MGPQGQDWAGDPAAAPVSLVVLAVEGGCGPILLTDGVYGRRVAQGPGVLRPHLGREGAGLLGPRVQRIIKQRVRLAPEEALGQTAGRGEKGPQPEAEREVLVDATEHIP